MKNEWLKTGPNVCFHTYLHCTGLIVAVGISNLQYVDLNSSRNLFIIGFSFLVGLSIPEWIKANPSAINTGMCYRASAFNIKAHQLCLTNLKFAITFLIPPLYIISEAYDVPFLAELMQSLLVVIFHCLLTLVAQIEIGTTGSWSCVRGSLRLLSTCVQRFRSIEKISRSQLSTSLCILKVAGSCINA